MIRPKEPSYTKVNYLLRLRKQIERKIIIATIRKIGATLKLKIDKYTYLGLGSIFFADFILFHKYLDINDMVSLELPPEEVEGQPSRDRFYFNKPYRFIKLEFTLSTEFLKKELYENNFSWERPLIIWLDYDDKLTIDTAKKYMIDDLKLIGQKAKVGDIFITTIECWRDFDTAQSTIEKEEIRRYLNNYREINKLEEEIEKTDEKKWSPKISAKILNEFVWGCIRSGMPNRTEVNLDFIQIFYFCYEDTTPMYTFGCLFVDKKKKTEIENDLKKEGIYFYKIDDEPLSINCPILTPKEKYYLDSCIMYQQDYNQSSVLIDENLLYKAGIGLPDQYIESYKRFYRYYPQFFESIY